MGRLVFSEVCFDGCLVLLFKTSCLRFAELFGALLFAVWTCLVWLVCLIMFRLLALLVVLIFD